MALLTDATETTSAAPTRADRARGIRGVLSQLTVGRTAWSDSGPRPQALERLKVICVTPLGEDVASIV